MRSWRKGRISNRSTTSHAVPAAATHISSGNSIATTKDEVMGAARTLVRSDRSATPSADRIVSMRASGVEPGVADRSSESSPSISVCW